MPWLFKIFTGVLSVFVAYLYWFGMQHHLFWLIWWYDIPLHIMAGLGIGLWSILLLPYLRNMTLYRLLVTTLLVTFIVGVSWEIFETIVGLTQSSIGYWPDTIKDMSDDLLGALIAVALYWSLYGKHVEHV